MKLTGIMLNEINQTHTAQFHLHEVPRVVKIIRDRKIEEWVPAAGRRGEWSIELDKAVVHVIRLVSFP